MQKMLLSLLGVVVLAGTAVADPPRDEVLAEAAVRPSGPLPIESDDGRSAATGEPSRPVTKSRSASVELLPLRPFTVRYDGDGRLVRMLRGGGGVPTALASGDLDRDGVSDLVCGYTGPASSVVTIHRGNVDALYPDSPGARLRRQGGTFTHAPFLDPARLFEVPGPPDFLATGDFDNDGRWDVVAATSGDHALFLLPGDGSGGLGPPRRVAIDGAVRTLTSGEVNRADGVTDILVGVSTPEGWAVLVFEGPRAILQEDPQRIPLSSAPTALALGRLTTGTFIDLAVAAGNDLLIVQGRDRRMYLHEKRRAIVDPPIVVEAASFDSPIRAISIGDYVWTGRLGREIAVVDANGTLHLVGEVNEGSARSWRQSGEIERTFSGDVDIMLGTARVSGLPLDELVALDRSDRRLHVMLGEVGVTDDPSAMIEVGQSLSEELNGRPIAMHTMRLDRDALDDIVVLEAGSIEPRLLLGAPAAVLTVNSTTEPPATNGSCELAEAIDNANANFAVHADCAAGVGADLIAFAISPVGSPATIVPLGMSLPALTDPGDTIDGTTQGCALPPCIELEGSSATPSAPGLSITASVTVRGLAIGNFDGPGILLDGSFGGAIVEGNYIGTDAAGAAARPNNGNGVELVDSSGNVVGGTVPAARNVISANVAAGIGITATAQGLGADNTIQGNFIGTDAAGATALGNGEGVSVIGGAGNVIGGTTAGAGNLISANVGDGIATRDGASGNLVQQNLVGTNVDGLLPLGNGGHGVLLRDSPSNTVGGATPGAGNVVSANGGVGIGAGAFVAPGNADFTVVQGNLVGLDASGTTALGQGFHGIILQDSSFSTVGGSTPAARNVSSASPNYGVYLLGNNFAPQFTTQNVVQGNYVGTDVSGSVALGNNTGVAAWDAPGNLIGGAYPGEGNLISGNSWYGIDFITDSTGDGNRIEGNFIGTDASGTGIVENGDGVYIATDNNTVGGIAEGAGNLISGNSSAVWVGGGGSGNQIRGNFIGTDVSGSGDLGNWTGVHITDSDENTIGGAEGGAGNLISANLFGGIVISNGLGNQIRGNLIGTNANGTWSPFLGNGLGVLIHQSGDGNVVGGTEPGAGNLISANGQGVIIDSSTGTELLGNMIGADIFGDPDLGNQVDGILVRESEGNPASGNKIGGTGAGAGNLIVDNGDNGVLITATLGANNAVLGNSIFANHELGIDLRGEGVTANDPGDTDSGPNMLQNFPVMASASIDATTTSVECTLNSLANRTFRIEFFSSNVCDPSGHGEAERWLGAGYASTDGSGNATYPAAYPNANPPGVFITATATDDSGNTSEFSACHALPDGDGDQFPDGPDCAPGDDQLWQIPGEARGLLLTHTGGVAGTTGLDWTAPDPPGGTPDSIRYDTVASAAPDDFTTSLVCVESNGANTSSTDTHIPASGVIRYYLLRAENGCGEGSVGTGTSLPRSAGSCPP